MVGLLVVVVVGVLGCTAETGGPSDPEAIDPALAAALSPELLAALTPAGQFRTEGLVSTTVPLLDKTLAEALAVVFARTYAPHDRTSLQKERGGPIDFPNLRVCGRSMLSQSGFDPAADPAVWARNVTGPYWVVTLCGAGSPELSVAVAATAVELAIRGSLIDFPKSHGAEFWPRGIPAGWDGGLAVSPERAAIIASQALGTRVIEAPRLVSPGPGWIPQAAQWLVRLEGGSDRRGLAAQDGSQSVFVGLRLDGVPAVGTDAVIAQMPTSAPRAVAANGPPMQLPALARTGLLPGVDLAACQVGQPMEEPLTHAIITDVVGWNNAELDGSLDDPLFPVSVPGALSDQIYHGSIIGNAGGTGRPSPVSNGELKFFDFDGPDFGDLPFNSWIDYTEFASRVLGSQKLL